MYVRQPKPHGRSKPNQNSCLRAGEKAPTGFRVLVNVVRNGVVNLVCSKSNPNIREKIFTVSKGKVVLTLDRNRYLKQIIKVVGSNRPSRLLKGLRGLILLKV
jgi:hypothetical protein